MIVFHRTPDHEGGMTRLTERDLDEAVEAGLISADQRQGLLELATDRHRPAGRPADRPAPDDEPFDLFQGFAEIFVALGLVILMAGVGGLLETMVAPGLSPFALLLISAAAGHYYARHRRMTLPSITALVGLTISFIWLLAPFVDGTSIAGGSPSVQLLIISLATFVMLMGCFRRYRLPFTMFPAGISMLVAILALAELATGDGGKTFLSDGFFDLRENLAAALGVLGFGLLALTAALRFDMRDPLRVGGASKSAFWLHILAGPAIVNTVTVTLFNIGGVPGHVLTVVMLVATTFLSLVIDRRSFLTAGLVYIGAVLGFYTDAFGDSGFYINALIIGLLVTALGTWWRVLRRITMSALPDFPGKTRLAPYGSKDSK